jgi:hypothetical protein
MDVNCRNGKWDFELSQIKWDKNEWKPWNIRGSWSVWKSEAANSYTWLNSLCKMYNTDIYCFVNGSIINMLLLTSPAKIQIVVLFSFKFTHFLNLRACKNYHIIINVGTSSLEDRNIRFVNSNLSRVQESKLRNLRNNPSSLKLQSRDQNLI